MLCKKSLLILVLYCVFVTGKIISKESRQSVRYFPDGFLFGCATASYQVEGAWNEDGKAENIWDHMTHEVPSPIKDGSTGDIADDSYHQYKRDVEMMRELGLDYYRFSLSWARILPNSFADQINEAGVQYYNNFINEMLKYNIEPMITLYHWDLPQKLQDLGGWTNPYIVDWYADYARIVFDTFGDRVKNWITMNEPAVICNLGYGSSRIAPRLNMTGVADYMCVKNLLLAHAKAWHIYDEEFRPEQGGKLGIAYSASFYEPESEEHADIAETYFEFDLGLYANPIYGTGDYPQVVKENVAAKSAAQGYPRSRLPELTEQEIVYIRGTYDFFGLNHYTSQLVYKNESVTGYYEEPSFDDDIGGIGYQPEDWEGAQSTWLKVVPWGFYKLLTKIREHYGNPPVYITENGFSTSGGLDDDGRVNYYRQYLDAMLDAIDDGSDIRAYTAWSLMDNFEWSMGYTERFGLYEVDYDSPERTRTPRKSAFVYKEILRTRSLDIDYVPDTTTMTIDEGH